MEKVHSWQQKESEHSFTITIRRAHIHEEAEQRT